MFVFPLDTILIAILLMCNVARQSFGETHWLVTEDGRVQSLADSLFNMAKPHDFVQFYKQDDRVRRSDEAKMRLTNQKSVINHHEEQDDPQIENRLMSTDPDCILAGKPLVQQDLFTSTIIPLENFGIDWNEIVGRLKTVPFPVEEFQTPACSKFVDLPFSMAAFEHLESVNSRDVLSSAPEPMVALLAFPGWPVLDEIGHAVAVSLEMESDSWILYLMASYYWRTIGNAQQALECLRRALHFAPKNMIVVPMLSLANVLHQTSHSREAVIVLETALMHNDSISHVYFTLGHALVVSLKYNESIEAFELCLQLDPDYPLAKIHQAAVKCHKKLENALEAQHQNLQKTLTELQSYQVRLKNFQKLHDDTTRHVVDPTLRQDMSLVYDHFAYGPLDGLECNWTVNEDGRYLDCQITDYQAYKTMKLSRFKNFDTSPADETFKTNVKVMSTTPTRHNYQDTVTIRQTVGTNGRVVDFDKEKEYLDNLKKIKGSFANVEPITIDRQKLSDKMLNHAVGEQYFDSESWPDNSECSVEKLPAMPTLHHVPHLFLSPDIKGFNITMLLTKGLLLEPVGAEHPLPWYPPFCSPFVNKNVNLHLPCCDHLLGVQRAKNREKQHLLPEPELKELLLNISGVTSNSEAEVGQRILSALKFDIGPKWMIFNVAALYWRVIGMVSESVSCLRLALNEAEQRFADVGLFQLSYLSLSAGNRLDDAIALLHQAIAIDPDEYLTHYMLAFYYIIKENFNASATHLRFVLDLKPNHADALDLLKFSRCKIRAKKVEDAKVKIEKPPLRQSFESESVPKFFCLKENGREHCYLEERMLPGATKEELEAAVCPLISGAAFSDCSKSTPFSFVKSNSASQPSNGGIEKPTSSIGEREKIIIKHEAPKIVEQEDLGPELSLVDASLQMPSSSSGSGVENVYPGDDHTEKSTHQSSHANLADVDDEEDVDEEDHSDNANQRDDSNSDADDKDQQQHRKPSMFDQLLETIKVEVEKQERVQNAVIPPDQSPELSGFLHLDNGEPEILPVPAAEQVRQAASFVSLPTSAAECTIWKNRVKPDQATSTWLSVTAKGINVRSYIDFNAAIPKELVEPECPSNPPFSMWTMDHLQGYVNKFNLTLYKAERGLKDAFQNLGGSKRDSVETLATSIALAMKQLETAYFIQDGAIAVEDDAIWVLSTLAALYWRVKGNASAAIDCLRHSLTFAPLHMKDLALVSLANIYHQSGFYHSALITAGTALRNSPRFVVVHFTLANIYASMGDVEKAMMFLYSTLSLQNNFEPAKDRIRALYCTSGYIPQLVADVLPPKV